MIAPEVLGYVLAGGESSRMQGSGLPRDKALLVLGRQTLLERALATVAEVCPDPRILCGTEERCTRLQHLGPTVADLVALAGPLGGLHAALHDARSRGAAWALVTPVDLPWMPSAVLRAFLQSARTSNAGAACMHVEGTPQPLPLVIETEAEHFLAAALRAGERKLMPVLQSIAERCGNRLGMFLVEADELLPGRRAGGCWFRNVNTPEDFAAVQGDETLGSAAHQSKHGG